jgi:putative ABC transport system permease protein
MLSNYFKIAFRSLLKHKAYATINLAGLSLGLMAGIFIMLFVVDELSYDNFHVKGDRIYRVNTSFYDPGATKGSANETNGWPVGKVLEKEFPEVESVLYTRSASYLTINYNDKRIRQSLHYATPEFFQLFSFPLIEGNSNNALNDPYSVVISKAMQEKYFPNGQALNKTLVMADTLQFIVTGVMENIPNNSHIQADMLVSFATYQKLESFSFNEGWGNINMRNYVLLKEGVDEQAFFAKAKNIYMDRVGDMMKSWGTTAYVEFEGMRDIYLKSEAGNGMGTLGSIKRVYMLIGIAAFVIMLACINFVNLATARSVYRAKEVGLRKVVGSTRGGLIAQFLSESLVLTAMALFIALGLLGVFMPLFNSLLAKSYNLTALLNSNIVIGVTILVLLITLLAGYYPAIIMSGMKPAAILKGKLQNNKQGTHLRRALVVFQFVISVVLLTGTFVVIQQLNFMQEKALGFSKDQVLVINSARVNASEPNAFEALKTELENLAFVSAVSYTNALPGTPGWVGQIAYPEGKDGDETVSVEYMAIDEKYISALDLELIAGRNFDKSRTQELANGLILNETAVKQFGWDSPEQALGKTITSPSGTPEGEVIGVVKDYHQSGLQRKVRPITMDYAPEYSYLFAVRYQTKETQQVIEATANLWKTKFEGYDFNYFFLDESFEKQYQAEQRLAKVLGMFSTITLIIATIGLLGLVSFMVVTRTKEIGIRKVLGANVISITSMLSKEFLLLVLLANGLAIPIVWYFAQEWLQGFAYRMEMNPLIFMYTSAIALLLTLVIVSTQTIRAAIANPVSSLRQE